MDYKTLLDERDLPEQWYNIVPDLPVPLPPVIHPGTHQPIGPDDLAPLFPMGLIAQEVSTDQYVPIPEEASPASPGETRPGLSPGISGEDNSVSDPEGSAPLRFSVIAWRDRLADEEGLFELGSCGAAPPLDLEP